MHGRSRGCIKVHPPPSPPSPRIARRPIVAVIYYARARGRSARRRHPARVFVFIETADHGGYRRPRFFKSFFHPESFCSFFERSRVAGGEEGTETAGRGNFSRAVFRATEREFLKDPRNGFEPSGATAREHFPRGDSFHFTDPRRFDYPAINGAKWRHKRRSARARATNGTPFDYNGTLYPRN